MDRRQYIVLVGSASVGAIAGCVGGDDDSTDGSDSGLEDGDDLDVEGEYPDGVEDGEEDGTDEDGYDMYRVNGQAVPLAPIDDVKPWYDTVEPVMADARSPSQYEEVHIEGAVSSPAPGGQDTDDPLAALPTDRLIVTYCGCPHTLSGHRAATLIDAGYTNVYALDEGILEWLERGYPVSGSGV